MGERSGRWVSGKYRCCSAPTGPLPNENCHGLPLPLPSLSACRTSDTDGLAASGLAGSGFDAAAGGGLAAAASGFTATASGFVGVLTLAFCVGGLRAGLDTDGVREEAVGGFSAVCTLLAATFASCTGAAVSLRKRVRAR